MHSGQHSLLTLIIYMNKQREENICFEISANEICQLQYWIFAILTGLL